MKKPDKIRALMAKIGAGKEAVKPKKAKKAKKKEDDSLKDKAKTLVKRIVSKKKK